MKKTWGVVVGVWMSFSSCERLADASRLDCDGCVELEQINRESPDLFVRAPKTWRFFQDYGAIAARACAEPVGTTQGTLKPLWERSLLSDVRFSEPLDTSLFAAPLGIDVSSTGTLVASTPAGLLMAKADTGEPLHLLEYFGHYGSENGIGTPGSTGGVHFTPDASKLWFDGGRLGLVDLTTYDRFHGFEARTWNDDIDGTWWAIDQSPMAADGTVFWSSIQGLIAMRPDGSKGWERPSVPGGLLLVNDDVLIINARSPRAVDALTGDLLWEGTEQVDSITGGGTWVAMAKGRTVTVRGLRDGAVMATFDLSPHTDFFVDLALVSEQGVLFVVVESNTLVAFDIASKRELWSRKIALAAPPVLGKNGRLYVATEDCGLQILDASGETIERYVMRGAAMRRQMLLRDGVLYLLSELPPLGGDRSDWATWVYPGSPQSPQPADGATIEETYGCRGPFGCFVMQPGTSSISVLGAFRVE